MASRDKKLQAVLDLLCRSVAADAARSADTARVLERVEARLGSMPEAEPAPQPVRFPICDLLDEALVLSTPLNAAVREIAADLTWYRRPGGDERFQQSHANTMLVGPNGLEPREDLWIGATLLAPHTDYPVHHHPPEEIYLVLSEGDWWREGTGWFTPGIGGTLYNQPNVRHAMRSHARPLFALWALPV
ncbi:dimethylsulfonioproprionate lyase family protein [Dongia sp.]|uniref:dimethylsulfonioproprionate lyase family protein n=1 Tax=Dongia sp. TaxID=1977262 RepID=UPI003752136A